MGEHRKTVVEKMLQLKDIVTDIRSLSVVEQVTLQVVASTALTLKHAAKSLYLQLEEETEKNIAARHLKTYKGIGPVISAQIVSEVAGIRRFPNNNHLASYAGLGRQEFKTGSSTTERSPHLFSRRLKNALMTGARCYTLFNPDSHLTGYYRSPVSKGMNTICVPFIFVGALVGKPLVSLIPEKAFRFFIMTIALIGAIHLFIQLYCDVSIPLAVSIKVRESQTSSSS